MGRGDSGQHVTQTVGVEYRSEFDRVYLHHPTVVKSVTVRQWDKLEFQDFVT